MPSACSNLPAATPRVTGAYLLPLLETAAERGIDAAALAAAAGLAPDALPALPLADPGTLPESLATHEYIALLDAGARLGSDPHFGLHVGERVRPGTYSVHGVVLMACQHLGQAFELTQRYEQLAHDLGRSQLALDGDVARYTWLTAYPRANRHLVESVFAGIRIFGCWLAGRPLAPREVCFAHDSGADLAEYERVLGVAPRFGTGANTAAFDAAILAMPVPNADPGLFPVLREHAERLLRERTRQGVVGEVHEAVLRRLSPDLARALAPEPVRLATVAADMGTSARTLQRKLADAGATFQQVLDGVRHALALDYLRQDGLSLVDIAFLLGYQEQSAFTHAFREWTGGVNPGAWRERQRMNGY
ncbi:AraC family transcriptional regulator [Massilia sp. TN1-12]|uniref:AraC family transcriptional regulator n=1 Tax=Massilia paldalensis TaxID=3377675 RepID=UPI0038500A38